MTLHRIVRASRRAFTIAGPPRPKFFEFQSQALHQAFFLLRLFFAWQVAESIENFYKLSSYLSVSKITPLPIAFWFNLIDYKSLVFFIFFFHLIAAILCTSFPEKRIFRILLFLSYLHKCAFFFSFGKINHDYSPTIWLLGFSVFLPSGYPEQLDSKRSRKHHFLTVFWWMQLMYLSFYWFAGAAKFMESVIIGPFIAGKKTMMDPEAMGNILAAYLQKQSLESCALWADFFIRNAWLGPPMILGVVYLQLFSFMACFRPKTYRIWAFVLALFHTLNILLIAIPFNKMAFGTALLFFCTPFYQSSKHWYEPILELPIFSLIYKLLLRLRKPEGRST